MILHDYHTLRGSLLSQSITCVQVVESFLQKIEDKKHLNAFLEVYAAEAISQASIVDQKIKDGTAGRLAGMVVGIKDVISHKDHGLQASSKILKGFVAQYNATVIDRLISEDAIIIGRQNCDEFAMGSSNENSAFGAVLNNLDPSRVPGGSSGGSAAAVQADLCHVSLGSDTGGSVRQPASFCGIVGLKPTYSRISRWGLIAYASSFDCIGILAKSVDDVALTLEVISGYDQKDSTVSANEVPKFTEFFVANKKYKIGYLAEGVQSEGVQKDIKENFKATIHNLADLGHTLKEIKLKYLPYAVPTYYILTTAEASSNLSRYDGVKFGYRSPDSEDLSSMYKLSRAQGFGKEVKKRIMLGTFVLSASYYDAYYTKAQKVRRLIKEEFDQLFQEFDFIISPTSPISPFKLGDFEKDALSMYLADIFTVSANIAGIPGISLPVGKDSNNMPIGLQILAKDFDERELLNFSKNIEGLTISL